VGGLAFRGRGDYACLTGATGANPDHCSLAKRKVRAMLVLTRKSNQSIMIGDDIEVTVLSVMGDKVRIGIQAPQEIPVFRTEIYLEIHREEGEHGEANAAPPSERAPTVSEDQPSSR
jgi:carbon storage regulator